MTTPISYDRYWVCPKCKGPQCASKKCNIKYNSGSDTLTVTCVMCSYWTVMLPADR